MSRKERLTVTVDRELVVVANEAVSAGRADSLSGWVNLALTERADKERRLQALADAIAQYESAFGEITTEEIVAQQRSDRSRAVVVRRRQRTVARPRKRRRA